MTPIALAVRSGNAPADQPPRVFTQEFTVGRHPSSGIVVENSSIVSGTHLRVVPTPQGWQIHLVSHTNGMLVDGAPNSGPVPVTRPVRVQLSNASGPTFLFVPQPVGPAGTGPTAPAGAAGAVGATGWGPTGPGSAPSAPSAAGRPAPGPRPAGPAPTQPSPDPLSGRTIVVHAGQASAPSAAPASGSPEDLLDPTAPVGQRRTISGVRLTRPGTIGRYPDNALVIPDPAVSGRHARVEMTPQGLLVVDNNSTNGIYVGGRRVPHVLVTRPTVIGMGGHFVEVNPDGLLKLQARGGELVARDLTFSVNDGRLTLLDGISFALPGNELLAVVGPSGAGKSTLLKALTGEQKAQKGQVLFDGLDVYSHYAVMRNRIGVVPQNDVVHADLTVRQTLQYAAELRFAKDVSKKERDERIAEVLADLDLTEHVGKKVKKLSGGQRKRVSTAIELLTKPGLLFLDEPTSGLDPQLDRDVMDLLASLAHGTRPGDTGRTVMVVTHNENHIDRADKVLILAAGGKPVYFGPPRDVIGYFEQRLADIYQGGRLITQAPSGGFADPTEITGFADVYALIRNHTPELRTRLEATVPSTRPGGARPSSDKSNRTPPKAPSQTALRQVSMLVRRHLRIIAADPSYLVFMLVLPIIMGLLTKAISGDFGFTVPDLDLTALTPAEVQNKHTNQALQLLVVLITGAAFAGMSVTIRELVGERDVFLREKAVGLRPGAYLTAKTIVLALVATVQTALMMGVAFAINKPPTDALVLKSAPLELSMCCWLTAFACGLMGLMVSAFVSSSAQVMPVLVVAIMGQIVMAGGLIDISGKVVFEQLAWFMPSRWGYAMAASTLDMNRIVTYRTDDLWEHTAHQWLIDFGCLSALALTCLLACLIGLVRRGRR